MHVSRLVACPSHRLPPYRGTGFLHKRALVCDPKPHFLEQGSASNHAPHPPSTETDCLYPATRVAWTMITRARDHTADCVTWALASEARDLFHRSSCAAPAAIPWCWLVTQTRSHIGAFPTRLGAGARGNPVAPSPVH